MTNLSPNTDLKKRPPIVVVMGHVDHGKTTLLDYIRKTSVAAREAGSITQAVGAYEIVHNSERITFIDTPGHEAFSKMRRRGAKAADLAILVVAADEGVKPQTKDALLHIVEEKIPYVVAINKIDKPNADMQKTKNDLMQAGVFLEGFGGNVSYAEISAKSGQGVNELLDLIVLAADVENLTYNPAAPVEGVVLTARLDKRRGLEAGVIVTNGTLKFGDSIYTSTAAAKVKILEDFTGQTAKSLLPSAPALVFGWEALPEIGDEFGTVNKKEGARSAKEKEKPVTGEGLRLILKADEAGSLEALSDLVARLQAENNLFVVGRGLGHVYENDAKLAQNTGAVIVAFHTSVDKAADNMIKAQKIFLIESKIIYEIERLLTDYLKKLNTGAVRAMEILAIFGGKKGKQQVIGGRVTKGSVKNQERFEVWETGPGGGKLVGEGRIINLQSKRVDAPEAAEGTECGLLVETEAAIKVGSELRFPDN